MENCGPINASERSIIIIRNALAQHFFFLNATKEKINILSTIDITSPYADKQLFTKNYRKSLHNGELTIQTD